MSAEQSLRRGRSHLQMLLLLLLTFFVLLLVMLSDAEKRLSTLIEKLLDETYEEMTWDCLTITLLLIENKRDKNNNYWQLV